MKCLRAEKFKTQSSIFLSRAGFALAFFTNFLAAAEGAQLFSCVTAVVAAVDHELSYKAWTKLCSEMFGH